MKNILLPLFLFLAISSVSAQDVTASKDTLWISGFNASSEDDYSDLYDEFIFKNINADSDTFRWKRISNILPSTEWESAVCDINLCHGTGVDSADFIMPLGESGYFSLHFYPGFGHGNGEMEVEIYNTRNTSQKVVVKAYATAWDAYNSVARIKPETTLAYPNPVVNDVLFIRAEGGTLFLKNMEGKTVLSQPAEKGTSIDIRHLPGGVYFVEIQEKNTTKIQKLIIQ